MPGLSVFYSMMEQSELADGAWEQALGGTRCDAPSTQRTLLQDSRCRIGFSSHPGYPIAIREDDRAFVCLEGRVYGDPAAVANGLSLLLDSAGAAAGADAEIAARVRDWDGDFVLAAYSKESQRLWLAGDALGRLPCYATQTDRMVAVSRDQRFLLRLIDVRSPDRVGIAMLLLFGYPIGTSTLIEGVTRLRPGHVLVASPTLPPAHRVLHDALDLEDKSRAARSIAQNAADLADLFVHACRQRAEGADPLVSLSGGLDSRAVAAGLTRAAVPFRTATYADASGVYEKEVDVARQVAEALGAPWQMFRIPAPSGDRLLRMLHMKLGLITLAMGFSLDFFARVRSTYGADVHFWSGDGGDKLFPDNRPRLSARHRADLARYIIEKHQVFPIEQVSRLVGLPAADIHTGVHALLARYPERTPEQKCVRFLWSERAYRWIFEGEDSNRHHFWTASPFYMRELVRVAMACPDEQKSGRRLYRLFMRHLDRRVTRIVDANTGVPLSSARYVWDRRAREMSRRFPGLQRLLRGTGGSSVLQPSHALVREVLLRQAERSAPVRDCFSAAELRGVATAPERWSAHAIECLLTATSAVEEITGARSTLSDFTDVSFG